MTNSDSCLFCQIVAGEIPADIVRATDDTIAFTDIAPQAPTHVLVVPREHHTDIATLASASPELAGQLMADAAGLAEELGLKEFRLVLNTGETAGQSVFHVHAHVMAGRPFTWPPG
ncbi:MAG TPA: histidine triad nucleotide-binding protein [Actinomycetes bacterium]|nr:histidine triad nucleotide-binding protein [Actinomycetes bacterium]